MAFGRAWQVWSEDFSMRLELMEMLRHEALFEAL